MDQNRLALNCAAPNSPSPRFAPRHHSIFCLALTAVLLLAAGSATADINVDANAAQSQQASVEQSERGVPIINIANPDSKGLSHNRFEVFNIDKPGAVFNNSLVAGISQLAGQVSANANLTQRAQVILNEVTGNQPSTLAGTLEVFGGKADVIVANPNGVTLNGVSTLNVHGMIASTGRPELTDGLYLNVADGNAQVVVGTEGISTQGLSYFDIVARVVTLNGKVGAPGASANVQIAAGLNRYNSKQRSVTVLSNSGAAAPGIAIDGSVAGAMYGRYITLISSENGVGVRHAGQLRAAQDIVIQANGDIDLTQMNADGQINLSTSTNLAINGTSNNTAIQASGAITMTAGQTITLDADVTGTRFTANAAALRLNKGTLKATGNDSATSAISIQVDDFSINSTLLAYDTIFGGFLSYDQPLVLKNGKLQVTRKPGQYDENFTLSSSAKIVSSGGIAIVAKRLRNDQGMIEDTSSKGIQITADTLSNLGIVRSAGDLTVNAGLLDNRCTEVTATQQICAGFFTNGAATINAASLNNQAGLIAKGDLNVQLGSGQHNASATGSIAAGNDLHVAQAVGAASNLNNNGELIGRRHLLVGLNTLNNSLTASTLAYGSLALDIGATFSNAGYLAAQGFAAIIAQDIQIISGARLLFAGGATLAAKASLAAQSHSSLYSSADLTINAGAQLTTAADVRSKGKLTLHADETLNNTGNVVSDTDVELSSKLMMKNDAGGLIYAMGSLMFSTDGDLNNLNGSMMLSDGSATFYVKNTFLNDHNSVIEGGNVMIVADVMRNRHTSLIHGLEDLNIMVGNYQDTSEGSILQLGNKILVQANMDEKGP